MPYFLWKSDALTLIPTTEGGEAVSLEDKVVITIDEPFQQISSGTTSGTVTTSKSCSKYVWI